MRFPSVTTSWSNAGLDLSVDFGSGPSQCITWLLYLDPLSTPSAARMATRFLVVLLPFLLHYLMLLMRLGDRLPRAAVSHAMVDGGNSQKRRPSVKINCFSSWLRRSRI
jgi:hypothetical protein